MSRWPGAPQEVWAQEVARDAGSAEPHWLPTPEDLPPWRSPEELDANYSALPLWWQRWMPLIFALVVGAVFVPVVLVSASQAEGLGRVLGLAVAALGCAAIVGCAIRLLFAERRFRRRRQAELREIHILMRRLAVPVWAVFEDRVRVSGGGDTVYDLQFVFDLRVPRETLALQRRVVEAWLDRIVATSDTGSPEDFETGFARHEPVHCVDVFGEGMRGVWIWSKPAILPFQVLGLAVDDPRETPSLTEENVAFLRRQPRELRRRSAIGRTP
ncbi:hypothetical protein [Microbacterium sp. CIAB417]|uniref:hypothetical protein n=1 Tax=Microbacterium sp. CIAB417 TaxID=2860287 RepID=UPI001FACDAC2|nr:hypothetical protein [Microbacterium sp. CIAB417]